MASNVFRSIGDVGEISGFFVSEIRRFFTSISLSRCCGPTSTVLCFRFDPAIEVVSRCQSEGQLCTINYVNINCRG